MSTARDRHLEALNARRQSLGRDLNNHYDRAIAAGRPMNSSEKQTEKSLLEQIDNTEAEIRDLVDRERREAESADLRNSMPGVFDGPGMSRWETEDRSNDALRNFLRPDGPRQLRVPVGQEVRARSRYGGPRNALRWDTGSIGSAVPTFMGEQLYEVMEAEIAMLRLPTTKMVTPTGANFDIPKLTAHTIGTQVIAQGTAIGGTDPTFDKTTFGAYKYGVLTEVSFEAIEDTSFDLTGFVMRDAARALGRIIDTDFVVGTGTGEPRGIFNAGATGAAGTVATGGTAIVPSYETLIDLQYSVNDSYRNGGNAAWLFADSTAAELRKLRDGAGGTIGAPLWQTSTTMGVAGARQPDLLLGDPALTDANVAAIGSANKIAAYGDWSAYTVRLVHDVLLERDDSLGFDRDVVYFRAKWRCDGDLLDATALNILNSNTA